MNEALRANDLGGLDYWQEHMQKWAVTAILCEAIHSPRGVGRPIEMGGRRFQILGQRTPSCYTNSLANTQGP